MRTLLFVLLGLLTLSTAAPAAEYLVKPDGSGDFPTIQAAIGGAAVGDTVTLGNGVFRGAGNRDLSIAGMSILLRSASGLADSCVIDCEKASRALTLSGVDSTCAITGLTLRAGYAEGGGAVRIESNASPRFASCIFVNNEASAYPGGGAITTYGAPVFTSCLLDSNWAAIQGGGISANAGSLTLVGCVLRGNRADYAGYCVGGAVYALESQVVISGCTFAENFAVYGSAVYIASGSMNAHNSIFFGLEGGFPFVCDAGSVQLECCNVFGALGSDWNQCIAGQLGQNGNIAANPMFCDPEAGDYRLYSASPCAPANNPFCGLIGALPVGCQNVAHLVKPDGTGDFPTIQAAIDAAAPGDTVLLADGIFTGDGNRDLDFRGKPILVGSASGDAAACIIDCQGTPNDPHCGFYFHSGEDNLSVLDRLTVQGGFVNGYIGSGVTADAVVCSGSSPLITGCVFTGNRGPHCAIFTDGSPTFRECTFFRNGASGTQTCVDLASGTPTFTQCTFADNTTSRGTLCVVGDGGGSTMDRCIVAFSRSGPAIASWYGNAPLTLTCCNIYGNSGGDWTGPIGGQRGVNGNTSAPPMFCNIDAGDITLHSASPCAAPNNPGCGQIGAWPVGCQTPPAPRSYAINAQGTGDFPTIHAGLSIALSGDTLELADGTYAGPENRDLAFWRKGITLRSQSDNPESCVLDCELAGRGVSSVFGEDSSTVIRGIKIARGFAGGTTAADELGGGLYCYGSSPTVLGCVFEENAASYSGGGMACFASSAPRIDACTFRGNSANVSGGGVYCQESSPRFDSTQFVANWASDGGAADFESSSATMSRGTLYGNSAERGGGLFVGNGGHLTLEQTIIADSPVGGALRVMVPSTVQLTCCDLHDNAGGDWYGPIAAQYGQNGNISEDPWFCDPTSGDLRLSAESPCLGGSCAQIGAQGAGCAGPAPLITRIADIRGDQGRQVRLTWLRSSFDRARDSAISGYAIYRRQDGTAVKSGVTDKITEEVTAGLDHGLRRLGGWDCLGSIPARGDSIYQYVASTLCDSTAAGICWSVFFVSALTPDPGAFFDSAPDSGYSVDNLAPAVPGNLRFSAPAVLAWSACPDPDFKYFTVYESATDSLDGTAALIGYTTGTSMQVAGRTLPFYHVTAADFADNEGLEATIRNPTSSTPMSPVPWTFALHEPTPQPVRGGATLRFDLAEPGRAALRLYDISGRLLMLLQEGEFAAGSHLYTWSGAGIDGRPLPAGIYFCRLETNGRTFARRLVVAP